MKVRKMFIWLAFLLMAAPPAVFAGESRTNHRAGDVVTYVVGCSALSDAQELATAIAEGRRDAMMPLTCFVLQRPLHAQLQEWQSGPYRTQRGPLSIWRLVDALGDTEYGLIPDGVGS